MGKRVLTAYERAVEEGVGIGKIEGKLEGEFQKAIETARRMRQEGDSIDKIIRITGLSLEDLEKNGLV